MWEVPWHPYSLLPGRLFLRLYSPLWMDSVGVASRERLTATVASDFGVVPVCFTTFVGRPLVTVLLTTARWVDIPENTDWRVAPLTRLQVWC